ncbi:MAG: tripartite tricarboxylate transporter substrate binding protein [Synergistaceae bacterium]|nr:tripartite tricarboxylate transporter substrate binding protein [Synergistaceae bacterium]
MKKLLLGLLVLALALPACAAEYPAKSIKLIVPFAAGGGTDLVARALASSAEKVLGQPIAIINKTGGSGAVGMAEGAGSKADGYTITMVTRELVSLPQLGTSPVGPDNFKLVALINEDPAIVLVTPDSKYASVKDIIDAAKAAPGALKFASTAQPNFYLLGLGILTDTTYNQIPYNGAAEAIPALMGNHVEFSMTGPAEAISQLKSGQLKGLGIAADSRMAAFPDIPTLKEQGIPLVTGTWRGIGVPPKTPQAVVDKLMSVFEQATKDPDFVKFMDEKTFGIHYMNSDEFTAFAKRDWDALGEVVKAIKAQQK